MKTFAECMHTYHNQIELGEIQAAYRGLMQYMQGLRAHFSRRYPDYQVSGSFYPGTMDMTFFALFPPPIKKRQLKIVVIFLHEQFCFEAWLAGKDRQVQARTWKLFRERGWDRYPIVPTIKGTDAIVRSPLAERPDFSDLDSLTQVIETGSVKFIQEVEAFLSNFGTFEV